MNGRLIFSPCSFIASVLYTISFVFASLLCSVITFLIHEAIYLDCQAILNLNLTSPVDYVWYNTRLTGPGCPKSVNACGFEREDKCLIFVDPPIKNSDILEYSPPKGLQVWHETSCVPGFLGISTNPHPIRIFLSQESIDESSKCIVGHFCLTFVIIILYLQFTRQSTANRLENRKKSDLQAYHSRLIEKWAEQSE